MIQVVQRKSFKLGKDVGVRLPRSFGVREGQPITIEKVGQSVVITLLDEVGYDAAPRQA